MQHGSPSSPFRTATFFAALACCVPFLTGSQLAAQASSSMVQNDGWSISADAQQSTVRIEYGPVGELVRDLRLYGNSEGTGVGPLTNWTVTQQGQQVLTIRTGKPATVWNLTIQGHTLLVSTTAEAGMISADTSAPLSRMPVRLMDPQGFPVIWKGTNEAQEAYGGDEPSSRSFLPRTRSEVSFYSLGLADPRPFHSLFDRPSDTAIDFPESTRMRRDTQDRSILHLEIPFSGAAQITVIPDYYTSVLGVPSYTPYTQDGSAPVIWNSWNAYYSAVTQQDIVQSTDWLEKNLKAYGLKYVVLDAGYNQNLKGKGALWLDWKTEAFPAGPKWLADYISAKGFTPGLWIVPNTAAAPLQAHPDWYVRSQQGNFIFDYGTASLDSSNPQVLRFLKEEFGTLHNWGFRYFKFDGEHALPKSAPDLDRTLLYDALADPTNVYRQRMQVIRDAVGSETFLEGCPAGRPLDGIGYFNSYSNGFDLYSNWDGMYSLFSAIHANAFLNHIVTYVMPGEGLSLTPAMPVERARKQRVAEDITTIEEREKPADIGTSDAEARTLVSTVALTGVAYPVADYLLDLPQSRIELLHSTLPTMPILPVDLFSRGSNITFTEFRDIASDHFIHHYPEVIDLKVNRGSTDYDVVAFTNWRGAIQHKALRIEDTLGLDPHARYVAFDFWNQQPAGVLSDTLDVAVAPHDTRVLQIYPLLHRPQILGTSRHITAAYSIKGETWDAGSRTLHATSREMANEPYSVWLHVPQAFHAAKPAVKIAGAADSGVKLHSQGEFLKLTFTRKDAPIAWSVSF